jgi:uncharacterized membrane protein
MSTIVAFTVSNKEMGEEALERLEGNVQDVAMVYKTDKGKVKLVQTSDLTAGQGVVRGGLIGAVASIIAGPLLPVAAAGGAAGAAYAAIRDKGLSDKVMKLAGKQLEQGGAAVFVLAEDEQAASIEAAVRAAGIADVEVGSFPEEAAGVARETLKLA